MTCALLYLKTQLGHASELFNFARTIAGSTGIAAMSTRLARGSQVHQVRLAAQTSPYDQDCGSACRR